MSLLRARHLRLSFGLEPLLDDVDFSIDAGERVCLVGRNGCGKSTFFKVLEGAIPPEDGEVERRQGLRTGSLAQALPTDAAGTVFDCVAAGLGDLGELIRQYHRLSLQLAETPGDALMAQLEAVQHRLESQSGWTLEQQVETVLSRLKLDPDARLDKLSGGLQRRVLLARALVAGPDLLLLDEPTNHLDIESIEWLENFLLESSATLLFITHDRRFLARLATRIVDLDRGRLTSWPGDYAGYLRRKQAWLDSEAGHQAAMDRKLAQEERWIRQGIKARRTRNEGRVRALEKLRDERRSRREQPGTARLQVEEAARSGRLVAECLDVSYSVGGHPLIEAFSTLVMRGDRIGIIGPNGAGKTTLLRLLLGELEPDRGTVRQGTGLKIAYFDQRRAALDDQKTLLDNLADGRQFIEVAGRQRHIIGYLQDFLFTPARCRSPVSALSGGERNRLLLAKLFSKPSNLLVLDEPTNDLDIETLDLLEELLSEYRGTVLLVSHDRDFIDRVATGTLVFEGAARVNEYVGGYSDWLRQRRQPPPAADPPNRKSAPQRSSAPGPQKLGYKEQRELEQLPARIETLEAAIAELHNRMADPDFFRLPGETIAAAQEELSSAEADLQRAYDRWETLETPAARDAPDNTPSNPA